MNTRFLEIFLKEWDLYQKQGGTPTVCKGKSGKSSGDFDKSVCAGEIRVFADSDRQLIGLVYKSWGEDAWIIIPVSEFSVPATEQEILIGSRVYQFWNAFTASAAFVERSWLIDILSPDDQQDICEALLHVTIGEPIRDDLKDCLGENISSVDDPRLEYERAFVVSAGLLAKNDESRNILEDGVMQDRIMWLASLWEKYRLNETRYALAAATAELQPRVPVLVRPDAWNAMTDGREVSGFSGYYAGDENRVLKFILDGDLPSELSDGDVLSVSAYMRETRELVGTGKMRHQEDGAWSVFVRLGSDITPVDVPDAGDLVLVVG